MEVIDRFSGEYKFLSNFYDSTAMYDGVIYPTSEHAFQAAKTLDLEMRAKIRNPSSPKEAKALGRSVTLRPDWEKVKFGIMHTIVLDKFMRSMRLRKKLLETGSARLIEGNTWGDRVWGVCNGEGENYLGKILMRVRAELRAQPFDELKQGEEK